jgi:hypothetical protein
LSSLVLGFRAASFGFLQVLLAELEVVLATLLASWQLPLFLLVVFHQIQLAGVLLMMLLWTGQPLPL